MAARLAKLRAIDVEYKRVLCGAGGVPEPRAWRAGHHVSLLGRPNRHRRPRVAQVVELEVHDVEHEPGAAGTAALQGGGHWRVQREVGLGRPGGLRHRGADHRALLPMRHARVEVKARERVNNHEQSKEPKKKSPRRFIQYPS